MVLDRVKKLYLAGKRLLATARASTVLAFVEKWGPSLRSYLYRIGTRDTPWWDLYFGLFKGYYIPASIATSLFVFSVGAGISWLIDFDGVYLSTIPIYLGVFGIA